jgi:hypothetical protein
MFNKIKSFFGLYDRPDYYTIQKTPAGKWGIYDEDGHTINAYTRRRDAYRGAERANLTLV